MNVAVVFLPRMINFTDFDRLAEEEDVALRDAATPGDLAGADVIELPGTKNTVEDLRYLGQADFTEAIRERVARRREWSEYAAVSRCWGEALPIQMGPSPAGLPKGLAC